MELRDFLKIFLKDKGFIIGFAIIGALAAFIFVTKIPQGYSASLLFFLAAQDKEETSMGSQFAQEKAANFTDTAVSLISSSEFAAKLSSPANISARKLAPQLIRVTTTANSVAQVQDTISQIAPLFDRQIASLQGQNPKVSLVATSQTPPVSSNQPKMVATVIFGFLLGFLFGLVSAGFKNYFRL